MYINFDVLEHKNLSIDDLMLLQIAKQSKTEDLSRHISKYPWDRVEFLLSIGYLTEIKGSKKSPRHSKIRLSKKGNTTLNDIETPEVSPEDIILFDWISKVYIDLGKEIGNKKKTKMYIALFRVNSGIEKNCLATLIEHFVNDEDNMEYNFKLEYAFFKPTNVFQVKFDIEQSRLYRYYLKRKDYFDDKFRQLEKKAA